MIDRIWAYVQRCDENAWPIPVEDGDTNIRARSGFCPICKSNAVICLFDPDYPHCKMCEMVCDRFDRGHRPTNHAVEVYEPHRNFHFERQDVDTSHQSEDTSGSRDSGTSRHDLHIVCPSIPTRRTDFPRHRSHWHISSRDAIFQSLGLSTCVCDTSELNR